MMGLGNGDSSGPVEEPDYEKEENDKLCAADEKLDAERGK